jgi:hypothetical protein
MKEPEFRKQNSEIKNQNAEFRPFSGFRFLISEFRFPSQYSSADSIS